MFKTQKDRNKTSVLSKMLYGVITIVKVVVIFSILAEVSRITKAIDPLVVGHPQRVA